MTHGSLFSGIGGFDLAAEWMGWENKFHCEWNPFGQKVLKYYWPESELFTDITKSDFTKYANQIDVLTGGFPCQPYSMAGKRLGKEDDRHLWPEMLRVIREVKPRWVIGENVLGLVNWNGGLVFHEVQTDLKAQGYEVWPYVLPAVSVNAPHRRDRVWFVAYNNGFIRGTGRNAEFAEQSRYRESILPKTEERPTPNPNGNGLNQRNGNDEEQPGEGGEYALGNADTGNEYGDATNTKDIRREDALENGKLEGRRLRESYKRDVWDSFPSVSPICSGDDGLSNRLDGITFPKWRNESIKAGGNAIVPQVAFQIFKTIQKLNNDLHPM